jgi:hypothetical protein
MKKKVGQKKITGLLTSDDKPLETLKNISV